MSSAQGQKVTGGVFLYRLYMAELSLFGFSQSIFDVRERKTLESTGPVIYKHKANVGRWPRMQARARGEHLKLLLHLSFCAGTHTQTKTHTWAYSHRRVEGRTEGNCFSYI